jgi:hypothetical protein
MDVRRMDALSDWDDWADDEPEWWLRHPLHRPRKRRSVRGRPYPRKDYPQTAKKLTLA